MRAPRPPRHGRRRASAPGVAEQEEPVARHSARTCRGTRLARRTARMRGVGHEDAGAGRRARRRAAGGPANGRVGVGGGQGRVDVPERLGEAAGVDGARGPRGRSPARPSTSRAVLGGAPSSCGHEEVHRRRRDGEVLPRRRVALVVVALQQLGGRPAAQDERDLPRGVLRVGHARVEPAGAERRDEVRGVAREQHPARPASGRRSGTGSGRPSSRRSRRAGPRSRRGSARPAPRTPPPRPGRSRRGTCQSMRNVESGQGWTSTCRPGFHTGSKWNRRSVAHPGRSVRMSQMRKRSSNECPSNDTPSGPRRSSHRAPAQTSSVRGAQLRAVGDAHRDPVRVLRDVDDPVAPPHVDQRLRGDPLVEDLLGAGLGEVDERRERGAARVGERVGEQLRIAVERAGGGPGEALGGDPGACADGLPDVEDVALLADRLGTDEVAGGPPVQQHDRDAPAGQQQRGRLPDRPVAEDDDRPWA